MSLSSRLYERAQQAKHFFKQLWATWVARRRQVKRNRDGQHRQLDALEPRVLLSGSISGRLFSDADADGTSAASEQGLAGWIVFLDDNDNQSPDTGEMSVLSGVDGSFTFDDLPQGTFRVRAVPEVGWTRTTPGLDLHTVALAENEAVTGKDFGCHYTRVIDNGGDGHTLTGNWWSESNSAAYGGSASLSQRGSGNDSSTWTFAGLPDGHYEVQLTWPGHFYNAVDTIVTVLDGAIAEVPQRINQAVSPNDALAGGQWWERLGVFHVENGVLVVTLTDAATSEYFVAADAVRVIAVAEAPAQPLPRIIDETDPDAVPTGAWTWSTGGFDGNHAITNRGSGADRFVWQLAGLDDGWYEVQATWDGHVYNSVDAVYSLFDGDEARGIRRANHSIDPDDIEAQGRWWDRLGVINVESGVLKVELSDTATSDYFVVADAIRVVAAEPPATVLPVIVDETHLAASAVGAWSWYSGGYEGNVAASNRGNGADKFTWAVEGLADGYYEIQATWPSNSDLALDAAYSLFDGTEARGTRRVNQSINPNDVEAQGHWWDKLGVIYVESGVLKVELSDAATSNYSVAADAIRVLAADPPAVSQVIDESDLQAAFTGTQWWWFTSPGSYESDAVATSRGNGSDRLTWTFDDVAVGTYDVFTSWPVYSYHAVDTPFTVRDGSTIEARHRINQARQPQDVQAEGIWWKYLGTFDVSNGQLSVEMADNGTSEYYMVGDAVRMVPNTVAPLPPRTIDEGDAQAAATGSDWTWYADGSSLNGDFALSNRGTNPPDKFRWEFQNLTTGEYEVYVSYPAHGYYASDAPYSVTNGTTTLGSIAVNQQVAATDLFHAGVWWRLLGVFNATNGTLAVELSDSASTSYYVVADGAFVRSAINVTATGNPTVLEGSMFTLNLSSYGVAAMVVDWGDGSAPTTLPATATYADHVYADGFHHREITVEGLDSGGQVITTGTLELDVLNVAPSLSLTVDGLIKEGTEFTLDLGALDPGADTITQWIIDWGDAPGSPQVIEGNPSSVTHTYADGPVQYHITATAVDEDGSFSWSGGGGDAGTLDPSFGGTGKVTTPLNDYPWVSGLALQPDGRAIVIGSDGAGGVALLRYMSDGSLDSGFGVNGIVAIDIVPGQWESVSDVAIQPDGGVIVAGSDGEGDMLVARFLQNGQLDTTYGSAGVAIIDVRGGDDSAARLLLLNGGEVIVAGTSADATGNYDYVVARLDSSGALITTWGQNGVAWINASAGTYDYDWAYDALLQADGKIVLTGSAYASDDTTDFTLVRFNADGSPDLTFGINGVAGAGFAAGAFEYGYALAQQPDGKLLVSGYDPSGDVNVVRFLASGAVNTTFGINGRSFIDVDGGATVAEMMIDDSGRILISGSTGNGAFTVFRLTAEGAADSTFGIGGNGQVHTSFGSGWAYPADMAISAEGLLYVAGAVYTGSSYEFAVARYFAGESGLPIDVENVAPQVTISGSRSASEGSQYVLDVGSIVDPGHDTIAEFRVYWGDALAGATGSDLYQTYPGTATEFTHAYLDGPAGMVIRVDAIDEDGIALASIELAADDTPNLIDLQAAPTGFDDTHFHRLVVFDGGFISIGSEWSVATGYNFSLRRFLADGALDTTWRTATDFGADEFAKAAGVDSEGRLIVTGYRRTGSDYDIIVARYLSDGALDEGFADDGKLTIDFGGDEYAYSLAIDDEDGIILAGSATTEVSRDMLVVRIDSTGELDDDFADEGHALIDIAESFDVGYGAVIDDFGAITVIGGSLIEGTWHAAATRLTDDGDMDATFGTAGVWRSDLGSSDGVILTAVTTAANGAMLVVGHGTSGEADNLVVAARLTSAGTFDATFGAESSGVLAVNPGAGNDELYSVALDDDGRAVLAGHSWNSDNASYDLLLIGLTVSGMLDDDFGNASTPGVISQDWSGSNDLGYGIAPSGNHWLVATATPFSTPDVPSAIPVNVDGRLSAARIVVNNVAPILTIDGAGEASEGMPYTVDLNGLEPSGSPDTISAWVINWGDGAVSRVSGSSATHIYFIAGSEASSASYQITAKATDEDGSYTANTQTVQVNRLIPNRPQDLSGSMTEEHDVELTWSVVARAANANYEVYRSVGGGSWQIRPLNITVNNGVLTAIDPYDATHPGQLHRYRVVATNEAGESQPSNVVTVDVTPRTPDAPLIESLEVSPTGETASATLVWAEVDVHPDLEAGLKYRVTRRNLVTGAATTTLLTATTFQDTWLDPYISYSYSVEAVAGLRTGFAASIDLPSIPQGLSTARSTVESGELISFNWRAVVGADSYKIYRSATAGQIDFAAEPYLYELGPGDPGYNPQNPEPQYHRSTSFSETIPSGEKYYYAVVAVSHAEVGDAIAEGRHSMETLWIEEIPAGDHTNSGTFRPESVMLAWNAIEGASTYGVYRNSDAENNYEKVLLTTVSGGQSAGAEVTFEDFWLDGSVVQPSYDIWAVTSRDKSSSTISGHAAPSAPRSVTATAFSSGVTVEWQYVGIGATYDVYRSTSPSPTALGTRIAEDIGWNFYFDTGAAAGTTVYYRVVAKHGQVEGAASRLVPCEVPPAPTVVGQVANARSLHTDYAYYNEFHGTFDYSRGWALYWDRTEGAVGYQILRRLVGGNEWEFVEYIADADIPADWGTSGISWFDYRTVWDVVVEDNPNNYEIAIRAVGGPETNPVTIPTLVPDPGCTRGILLADHKFVEVNDDDDDFDDIPDFNDASSTWPFDSNISSLHLRLMDVPAPVRFQFDSGLMNLIKGVDQSHINPGEEYTYTTLGYGDWAGSSDLTMSFGIEALSSHPAASIKAEVKDLVTNEWVEIGTVSINFFDVDISADRELVVNDDDDDGDQILDIYDGFNADRVRRSRSESVYAQDNANAADAVGAAGSNLKPMQVTIGPSINTSVARMAISYSASDPAVVYRDAPDKAGTVFEYGPEPTSLLRIWRGDGTGRTIETVSGADSVQGLFVKPGTNYKLEDLGINGGTTSYSLEGTKKGAAEIQWSLDPDGPGPARPVNIDPVRVTVTVESISVPVNNDDDDLDGIPDFADGFNRSSVSSAPDVLDNFANGNDFVEIVIPVSDPKIVKLSVTYDASLPWGTMRSGDGTMADPYLYRPGGMEPNGSFTGGALRFWSKPESGSRSASPFPGFGDFMQPNAPYALVPANGAFSVYVEAVHKLAGDAFIQIKGYDNQGREQVLYTGHVSVIAPNILVDSDNDGGATSIEDTPGAELLAQDQIENSAPELNGANPATLDGIAGIVRPGRIVSVNNGDLDRDGVPDYADGFNFDGVADTAASGSTDDDLALGVTGFGPFVPIVIELPEPIDFSTAHLTMDYTSSDPRKLTREGSGTLADPYRYMLPLPQQQDEGSGAAQLRLWTAPPSATNINRRSATPFFDGTQSALEATSHFVPPTGKGDGQKATYGPAELTKLGFESGTRRVTLYIEGVGGDFNLAAQKIKIAVNPKNALEQGFIAADEIRLSVGAFGDLRIDADNSELSTGSTYDPVLSFSHNDERFEDLGGQPGRTLVVNDGDFNSLVDDRAVGNGIPDFAEGITGKAEDHLTFFAPIQLRVPAWVDLETATLSFKYDESDPASITAHDAGTPGASYQPAPGTGGRPGSLRVWVPWSGGTRSPLSAFNSAGNYVAPNHANSASFAYLAEKLIPPGEEIVELHDGTRQITLYVEAVRPSLKPGDLTIEAYLDPDGAGTGWQATHIDTVRMTAVPTVHSDAQSGAVRMSEGAVVLTETDLSASARGMSWDFGRVFTTQVGAVADGTFGGGWSLNLPQLIQAGSAIVLLDKGQSRYFDLVRTNDPQTGQVDETKYVGRFSDSATVRAGAGWAVLTEPDGSRWTFGGSRYLFVSYISAEGNTVSVSRDAAGRVTHIINSGEVFKLNYEQDQSKPARLFSVDHIRGSNSVTTVAYDYYTDSGSGEFQGRVGDLRSVSTFEGGWAGGEHHRLGTVHYRYLPTLPGDPLRISMVIGGDGFERAIGAMQTGTPSVVDAAENLGVAFAASNDQIKRFADLRFVYEDDGRVREQWVQGAGAATTPGSTTDVTGGIRYEYNPRAQASTGINAWSLRVDERRIDVTGGYLPGETFHYFNYAGQTLLTVDEEDSSGEPGATRQWLSATQFDSQGRTVLEAGPDGVTGYGEAQPNLGLQFGTGLIRTYLYGTQTTATEEIRGDVEGYLKQVNIQRGPGGAPIRESTTYYTRFQRPEQPGVPKVPPIYPVSTHTVYRDAISGAGTGIDVAGAITTRYEYPTDPLHWRQLSPRWVLTHLPEVDHTQNGNGGDVTSLTVFDEYGRPVWTRDADGYLHSVTYGILDSVAGTTTDAPYAGAQAYLSSFITNASNVAALLGQTRWNQLHTDAAPLNLTTTTEVDDLGRPVRVKLPGGGGVGYSYFGSASKSSVIVSQEGGTTQTTMTDRRTGLVFHSEADGLTIDHLDLGGRVIWRDRYAALATDLNIPGQIPSNGIELAGLTPESETAPNAYYRDRFSYDVNGRLVRSVNSVGLITRTQYDALGRPIATLAGGADETLKVIESSVYDGGGVGAGNVTSVTQHPSGVPEGTQEEPNRVTEMFYDWRGRLTLTRQGNNDASTAAPATFVELNNLGWATTQYQLAGYGLTFSAVSGVLAADQPQLPSTSAVRAKTEIEYDNRSRPFRSKTYGVTLNEEGSAVVSSDFLTSATWYDERGNPIKSVAPTSLAVKTTYDGAGRPILQYATDGAGDAPAGETGTWSHAANVDDDVVYEQSQTQYDLNGNVQLVTTRQRHHNAAGAGPLGDASVQPNARVNQVAYWYDKANRVTVSAIYGVGANTPNVNADPVVTDASALFTTHAFDVEGRLASVTSPDGRTTSYKYDVLGRQIEVNEGGEGGDRRTTTYRFNGADQIVRQTLTEVDADPLAGSAPRTTTSITTYTFFGQSAPGLAYGRLHEVRYPIPPNTSLDGYIDTVSYNALGEVTQKVQRSGADHRYAYDALGRLISDRVLKLPTYQNGAGATVVAIDDAIMGFRYTYDSFGRPATFESYKASGTPSITRAQATYTVDLEPSERVNTVTRQYDGFSRPVKETQSGKPLALTGNGGRTFGADYSHVVEYGYAHDSTANYHRLNSVNYPGDYILSYHYEGLDAAANRVSRITEEGESTIEVSTYKYLGVSTLVERGYTQPGITLSYIRQAQDPSAPIGPDIYTGFDAFGRVVDQHWFNLSGSTFTTLDRFRYSYDNASNKLFRENALNHEFDEDYHGAGNDPLGRTTYFARGPLSSSTNPLNRRVESPNTEYSWDPDPEPPSDSSDEPPKDIPLAQKNFTDLIGHPTKARQGVADAVTEFTDAWGRVVSAAGWENAGAQTHVLSNLVTTFTAHVGHYAYDALGRRIAQADELRSWRMEQLSPAAGGAPLFIYPVEQTPVYDTARTYALGADGQVIEERVSGDPLSTAAHTALTVRYARGAAGELILRDRNLDGSPGFEERRYALTDADGSITSIAAPNAAGGASGGIVERYVYTPNLDRAAKANDGNVAQWVRPVVALSADWAPMPRSPGKLPGAADWRYLYMGGRYDPSSESFRIGTQDYDLMTGAWRTPDAAGIARGRAEGIARDRQAWVEYIDALNLRPLADIAHNVFDFVGMIDPTGIADTLNAGLYALQEDWAGARISLAAALLPYAGDALKATRMGQGMISAARSAKEYMAATRAAESALCRVFSAGLHAGASATAGAATGGMYGFVSGYLENGSFAEAWDAAGQGAMMGAGMGAAGGAVRGLFNSIVCFAEGTLVVTGLNEDGSYILTPIEQIEEGDLVLARDQYNEEDNVGLNPVVRLFRNISDHLRIVRIQDANGNVETIRTTDEHPFYIAGLGWMEAKDLVPGMRVNEADSSNDAMVLSSIREDLPEGITVYNFEIEGDHTYFVEDGIGPATAVWVHNVCTINYVKGAKGMYPAIDAFAEQLRRAVNVAERYLSNGGIASSPMARLYQKFKHLPFLGRMFKGSAIQQITDIVLTRKGILPTAAVSNLGSRLGLKATRLLRPDYQLDVGSRQWAIGDITAVGSAGKAIKYDHPSSPVIFEAMY